MKLPRNRQNETIPLVAAGRTFTISGGVLSNLIGGTLNGGTYDIAGTFQFPGAAITTNAATIVLDGPEAQIVNESNKNALASFATNAAGGSFTVQGGQAFTTPIAFTNASLLVVRPNSTFTAAGGLTNFAGGTLTGGSFLVAGTLRFPGADIHTNASTMTLDGPAARITDLVDKDALANFGANAAAGNLAIQNGSSLTVGTFNNAGSLVIGSGSTLTASGVYSQSSGASMLLYGTFNVVVAGSIDGTITNAGNLTLGAGAVVTISGVYTVTGTVIVPASTTLNLAGTFTNFVGSTLTGGTYVIGGTLVFVRANIEANAATIILDGPAARIVDEFNQDALANFRTNAAAGSFTIQNGRNFATGTSVGFNNIGVLEVGAGSTFTVPGSFTNTGDLFIDAGGTFTVPGIFTNFVSMTLTGGTYVVSGTLQFAGADIRTNAATIVVDGPAAQIIDLLNHDALAHFTTNTDAGSFTIQNGRNFATAGSVTFDNLGVIVIGAGCTFTVTGGFANFANRTLTGGTYVVAGTLQFPGADIRTNAATIGLDGPAAQIVDLANNDALANFTANATGSSFTIQNGRNFSLAGNFTNAGSLIVGYGSAFTANGAYTQTGSATISYGATLILAGGGSNSGSFIVASSGLVLFSAGTFTLDTGTILGGAGLFQIAGATVSITDAVNVPNLELDSGLLTVDGVLTITHSFSWTGGTLSGAGSTNLAAGSMFTISGSADKALGGLMLNLGGTTTWSDNGNLVLANKAVINNLSGALFLILNDQSIQGSGRFSNAGTLIKTTGTGMTTFAVGISFTNDGGAVDVENGTLSFAGDYTQNSGDTILASGATLAANGMVKILGGTLSGSGTIDGNVINSGQFNPIGMLTIHGDYTQTADGTLNIEISGLTDHSQLKVTGHATLDGTLNISLTNGFLPDLGDTLEILDFGSHSDDFRTEKGLDLGGGLQLVPTYDDTSLTLVMTGRGAPPPGGSASPNGGHHLPAWNEAAFSTLQGNLNGDVLCKAGAVANSGKMPSVCLDAFFQLLADSTGNTREPCGV